MEDHSYDHDDHLDGQTGEKEERGWLGDHVLKMAVPKKKSSHNKIARRQLHKALPRISHHVDCPKCGSPRLLHHLCIGCFWKEHKEAKRRLGILPSDPSRAKTE